MISEVLHRELRAVLVGAGVVFPDDELALIVRSVMDERSSGPDAAPARELKDRVLRRSAGEPLPYVIGRVEFRDLSLEIGPGAFIPRPDTSLLVDRAKRALPLGGVLADLCTGCGAIALAVASERPDATVVAGDVSAAALSWAKQNRDALGLDVMLLEGDLFAPFPDEARGGVDVVVANPPHVPSEGEHFMPRDVVQHEPPEALFSGPLGLSLIERIVEESPEWLRPGGWLVSEIGHSHAAAAVSLMRGSGYLDVATHADDAGRLRALEGRRPQE